MFKSKEQKQYEAEIDALAREKQLLRAQAADLAKQRQRKLEDTRELPLAYWLGWSVANNTRGSARVDLTRPRFPAVEPSNLFKRMSPAFAQGAASLGIGTTRSRYGGPGNRRQPLFGFGQGARIKVMRHIDFGIPSRSRRARSADAVETAEGELSKKGYLGRDADYSASNEPLLQREPDFGAAVSSVKDALKQNLTPLEKPWFDFGAGINIELDEGALRPSLRLKVKDFFSIKYHRKMAASICVAPPLKSGRSSKLFKLLPVPMVKVQKRLRLGLSNIGLRVNYELPFTDSTLQNPLTYPARLMIRMDNTAGGLKVGLGGADFDETVLQLGQSTSLRAALSVDFPKSLPLEEGERIFGWRARRLGIKTRW